MESIYRLKVSELNLNFINLIKSVFEKDNDIEILFSIKSSKDFKKETDALYLKKLDKAFDDIEVGNVISFTPDEFKEMNKKLISK